MGNLETEKTTDVLCCWSQCFRDIYYRETMRFFIEIMRLFSKLSKNNLNGKDFFFIETACQYWQYIYILNYDFSQG